MEDGLRRQDDKRFKDLDDKLNTITKDVGTIRDMLISEPEASPMGRALIRRSLDNRDMINQQRRDFDDFRKDEFAPVHDWWQQNKGAYRLVQGVAVVLGAVGAFFGIASFFGFGH